MHGRSLMCRRAAPTSTGFSCAEHQLDRPARPIPADDLENFLEALEQMRRQHEPEYRLHSWGGSTSSTRTARSLTLGGTRLTSWPERLPAQIRHLSSSPVIAACGRVFRVWPEYGFAAPREWARPPSYRTVDSVGDDPVILGAPAPMDFGERAGSLAPKAPSTQMLPRCPRVPVERRSAVSTRAWRDARTIDLLIKSGEKRKKAAPANLSRRRSATRARSVIAASPRHSRRRR